MINIKSFLILSATLSLLSGNTIKYNIQPMFDENTNQLIIDTLVLDNVSLINQHGKYDPNVENKLQRYKASYQIKSQICSKIRYSIMTADGRTSFSDNFEMFLRKKAIKENSSCQITKLANVRIHQCKDSKENDRYYISTSEAVPSGGFSKREYIMLDKQCFQTMTNHFTQKAKSENIEIINTITEKEPPVRFEWQINDTLDSQVSFTKAKEYCKNLTLNGQTNWRLPTKKEYYSTPNGYFMNANEEDQMLWTSTVYHSDKNIIWMQSLPEYDSSSGYYNKSDKKAYVKCVSDR